MTQDLSGSWCIKGTGESVTRVDSPVRLMPHDPDRSWITDPNSDHPKGMHPKIDSNLNFNTEYAGSFGDRKLLAFSSEANGESEKKNTFSAVEDSTLLRWHIRNTKTRREDETKGPNRQRSKAFLVKHCQNKTSKPH